MTAIRVQHTAARQIDDIYLYTRNRWGEAQARRYIGGLFAAFDDIARNPRRSRPVPAQIGVSGFVVRYEKHFIYWKTLDNGDLGIVTILHERMHHVGRLKDAFDQIQP